MKWLIVLFGLFMAHFAVAGDLQTAFLDTSAFYCNRQLQELRWTAPENIRVKQVTVWIGADGVSPTEADIGTCLFTENGTTLTCVGWDHYANPSGLHQWSQNFAPDWIKVKRGQDIILQAFCNGFNGEDRHANVQARWWYTTD